MCLTELKKKQRNGITSIQVTNVHDVSSLLKIRQVVEEGPRRTNCLKREGEAPQEVRNYYLRKNFHIHFFIPVLPFVLLSYFVYSLVTNNVFLSRFPLELFFNLVSEHYFIPLMNWNKVYQLQLSYYKCTLCKNAVNIISD